MRRIALPLAAALALALAATASAHKTARPMTTDPVALALQLGENYWQRQPPCAPTITFSSTLPQNVEPVPAGALQPGSAPGAWTVVPACSITFNVAYWPSWKVEDWGFQLFCDVMTHELGHLLGYGDADQTDPAAITYPFISPTSPNYAAVPECQHAVLWYGHERIVG